VIVAARRACSRSVGAGGTPPAGIIHGFESRWSHTRLCTDDSRQEPAERGLAAELVNPVLPLPEDDPPHQELPEDLAADCDLPPEQPPPVREARLHLSLDFLKVSGGDGPEPFEPGQLRLERSPPLLAGLDAVQERLEVAPGPPLP
jgi:hypothetical protein